MKLKIILLVAALFTLPVMAQTSPDHFSFTYHTTQGDISFDCPQGGPPWAKPGFTSS